MTKIQRGVLIHMLAFNHTSYATRNDRTLVALANKNLVEWRRAPRYGKPHWSLTAEGVRVANIEVLRKRDELLRDVAHARRAVGSYV